MRFQLYLQVVKLYLHSIFLANCVNTILIKQDYKIHVRYITGSTNLMYTCINGERLSNMQYIYMYIIFYVITSFNFLSLL